MTHSCAACGKSFKSRGSQKRHEQESCPSRAPSDRATKKAKKSHPILLPKATAVRTASSDCNTSQHNDFFPGDAVLFGESGEIIGIDMRGSQHPHLPPMQQCFADIDDAAYFDPCIDELPYELPYIDGLPCIDESRESREQPHDQDKDTDTSASADDDDDICLSALACSEHIDFDAACFLV